MDSEHQKTSVDSRKAGAAGLLHKLVEMSARFAEAALTFEANRIILEEGGKNDCLYIILQGQVELIKRRSDGSEIIVDRLGEGSFLGLLSFWAQTPSFTRSRTLSFVKCIRLGRKELDELTRSDPELNRLFQNIFIQDLVNRYRGVVDLNLKVASLTRDLEQERNQLKRIIQDLKQTRARLVHQEKLATLGQLLAGIAHELNNPAAALSRATQHMIEGLPRLFAENGDGTSNEAKLIREGMSCPFWSADQKRIRMDRMSDRYPLLDRSHWRRLAQLTDPALEMFHAAAASTDRSRTIATVERLLPFFETGVYLRSVRVTCERIHKLVKSLKAYGRQESGAMEKVDLRQGIHDTLTLLNNRLKHYRVDLDLRDIPKVACDPGEINQIWTNLLVNACDEMPPGGAIRLECGLEGGQVWARVMDSGPGIPESMLGDIFDPNFTTKSANREFGLGLGLAISKEIAEKHGGTLNAENRPEGGASFTLKLPADESS